MDGMNEISEGKKRLFSSGIKNIVCCLKCKLCSQWGPSSIFFLILGTLWFPTICLSPHYPEKRSLTRQCLWDRVPVHILNKQCKLFHKMLLCILLGDQKIILPDSTCQRNKNLSGITKHLHCHNLMRWDLVFHEFFKGSDRKMNNF